MAKIARNRQRDLQLTARLRRLGYKVIRIWEHELEPTVATAVMRLEAVLAKKGTYFKPK